MTQIVQGQTLFHAPQFNILRALDSAPLTSLESGGMTEKLQQPDNTLVVDRQTLNLISDTSIYCHDNSAANQLHQSGHSETISTLARAHQTTYSSSGLVLTPIIATEDSPGHAMDRLKGDNRNTAVDLGANITEPNTIVDEILGPDKG